MSYWSIANIAGLAAGSTPVGEPIIAELQAAGVTSLTGIAAGLNERASRLRAAAPGARRRSGACSIASDRSSSRRTPPVGGH
jgi:hypothetical protein